MTWLWIAYHVSFGKMTASVCFHKWSGWKRLCNNYARIVRSAFNIAGGIVTLAHNGALKIGCIWGSPTQITVHWELKQGKECNVGMWGSLGALSHKPQGDQEDGKPPSLPPFLSHSLSISLSHDPLGFPGYWKMEPRTHTSAQMAALSRDGCPFESVTPPWRQIQSGVPTQNGL